MDSKTCLMGRLELSALKSPTITSLLEIGRNESDLWTVIVWEPLHLRKSGQRSASPVLHQIFYLTCGAVCWRSVNLVAPGNDPLYLKSLLLFLLWGEKANMKMKTTRIDNRLNTSASRKRDWATDRDKWPCRDNRLNISVSQKRE